MALAFIENLQSLPEVNHIDEDKTNNKVDNLEWCSREYNCNHGTRNKRVAEKKSKAIIGYHKTNGYIVEFPSTMEAERCLGIASSSISRCCNRKGYKSVGGYVWHYIED